MNQKNEDEKKESDLDELKVQKYIRKLLIADLTVLFEEKLQKCIQLLGKNIKIMIV